MTSEEYKKMRRAADCRTEARDWRFARMSARRQPEASTDASVDAFFRYLLTFLSRCLSVTLIISATTSMSEHSYWSAGFLIFWAACAMKSDFSKDDDE